MKKQSVAEGEQHEMLQRLKSEGVPRQKAPKIRKLKQGGHGRDQFGTLLGPLLAEALSKAKEA